MYSRIWESSRGGVSRGLRSPPTRSIGGAPACRCRSLPPSLMSASRSLTSSMRPPGGDQESRRVDMSEGRWSRAAARPIENAVNLRKEYVLLHRLGDVPVHAGIEAHL